MTTLYGIKQTGSKLFIDSVEAKETKKLYKFSEYKSWLGYLSQIPKDDNRVHLSPEDALNAFIKAKEKRIAYLEGNLRQARELLVSARKLATEGKFWGMLDCKD